MSSTSSGTFSEQQSASLQSVELMVACLSLDYPERQAPSPCISAVSITFTCSRLA